MSDYLHRYQINSWTQPMHVFVDQSDEALCGITLEEANNQNDEHDYAATSFPASNNFVSLAEMLEAGEEDDGSLYCPECWDELASETGDEKEP